MELSTAALVILALTAFFTGISKLGIPGLGIVFVVLVPMAIPAKLSTAYILPFLIFGDILAILYWRKTVVWRIIAILLPAMIVGIVAGYFIMQHIGDAVYGRLLGSVVLSLLALDWARRRFKLPIPVGNRSVGYGIGWLAGVMTMLANAAGPVNMIYLLAMDITKEEFVGTRAWLYFITNMFKVPFSMSLGLMSVESLKINAMMLPFVVLGGVIGVLVMRKMSSKAFATTMRTFAFLGGLKLFFQ